MVMPLIEKVGSRILAVLPPVALRPFSPTIKDPRTGNILDPDVAIALAVLRLGVDFSDLPVPQARKVIDSDAKSGAFTHIKVGSVEPGIIAGVPVRIYRPAKTGPKTPTMIYAHGGGWVLGSLDSHDSTCRYFCANAGVIVISVDYRLAPEHKATAGLEDVVAVVKKALKGKIAGVDPSRVVVAGDSAGGNLAAATCIELVKENHPLPAYQMLFAPVTDLARAQRPPEPGSSYEAFDSGFYLSRKQMQWYTNHTIDENVSASDPRLSVLFADPDQLSQLPPTYIALAGFDVLFDEGLEYAELLTELGIDVTLKIHPKVVHPFVNAIDVWRSSREAMETATQELIRVIKP